MFCPKCGKQLNDGAQFCGGCGTQLSNAMLAPQAQQAAVAAPPQQQPLLQPQQPLPQDKKRFNKPLIAVVCVLAVVLVVLIGVVVMKNFVVGGNVTVDEKAFADEATRSAVLSQLDIDGDGELSTSEAEGVRSVVIGSDGVVSFAKVTEEADVDYATQARQAASQVTSMKAKGSTPQSVTNHVGQTFAPSEEKGWKILSNVTYLNISNQGYSALDLSAFDNVEYVVATGNNLTSVDVSNCKSLKGLYLDEGVEVIGLDKANLAETDLMVGATQNGSSDTEKITVEYDEHGLPVTQRHEDSYNSDYGCNTFTYEYDDQLRLISKKGSGPKKSETTTCTYDDQGNLTFADYVSSSDGYNSEEKAEYTYDDKGRVTEYVLQHLSSGELWGKIVRNFTYESEDRVIVDEVSWSNEYDEGGYTSEETVTYIYDKGVLVTKVLSYDGSSSTTYTYSYDEQGRLTAESYSWIGSDGDKNTGSTHYSYDETGLCKISDEYRTYTITQNADGFVTRIDNDNDYEPVYTARYVKFVGPAEELGDANRHYFLMRTMAGGLGDFDYMATEQGYTYGGFRGDAPWGGVIETTPFGLTLMRQGFSPYTTLDNAGKID